MSSLDSKLIYQSDSLITAQLGSIPLLHMKSANDFCPEMVKAINFLRCGTNKVQILVSGFAGVNLDKVLKFLENVTDESTEKLGAFGKTMPGVAPDLIFTIVRTKVSLSLAPIEHSQPTINTL